MPCRWSGVGRRPESAIVRAAAGEANHSMSGSREIRLVALEREPLKLLNESEYSTDVARAFPLALSISVSQHRYFETIFSDTS